MRICISVLVGFVVASVCTPASASIIISSTNIAVGSKVVLTWFDESAPFPPYNPPTPDGYTSLVYVYDSYVQGEVSILAPGSVEGAFSNLWFACGCGSGGNDISSAAFTFDKPGTTRYLTLTAMITSSP
jgi:hypothetical protein